MDILLFCSRGIMKHKFTMAGEEPPYLTVGTDVSAKYRGAFCEAKIKKVSRSVKCKVTFKDNSGIAIVTDDVIKGTLRVGVTVEAKHPETGLYSESVINKLTDCSLYTVVFDDGDEKTLRRTALCLKGARHFAESETLDQLPLTNPEHFGTPVIGSGKKQRKRRSYDGESSDEERPVKKKVSKEKEKDMDIGKVVCVDLGDKRKKDKWFPALVVSPSAQEGSKTKSKEEYLVRSFKDGKYHTPSKKETKDFTREIALRVDNNSLKTAVEKALVYLDKDELPPHWDRDVLMGKDSSDDESDEDTDSDSSDDEPSEEKDRFVAQLYKFMDDRGTPINKAPAIGTRDLNLYKLFKTVQKMGGYNKVTNQMHWKAVYTKMGLPSYNTASSHSIKSAYKKYLHSFEDFYRKLGISMGTSSRPGRGRISNGRSLAYARDMNREFKVIHDKAKLKEKEREKEKELKCEKDKEGEKEKPVEKNDEKEKPAYKSKDEEKRNVKSKDKDEDKSKNTSRDDKGKPKDRHHLASTSTALVHNLDSTEKEESKESKLSKRTNMRSFTGRRTIFKDDKKETNSSKKEETKKGDRIINKEIITKLDKNDLKDKKETDKKDKKVVDRKDKKDTDKIEFKKTFKKIESRNIESKEKEREKKEINKKEFDKNKRDSEKKETMKKEIDKKDFDKKETEKKDKNESIKKDCDKKDKKETPKKDIEKKDKKESPKREKKEIPKKDNEKKDKKDTPKKENERKDKKEIGVKDKKETDKKIIEKKDLKKIEPKVVKITETERNVKKGILKKDKEVGKIEAKSKYKINTEVEKNEIKNKKDIIKKDIDKKDKIEIVMEIEKKNEVDMEIEKKEKKETDKKEVEKNSELKQIEKKIEPNNIDNQESDKKDKESDKKSIEKKDKKELEKRPIEKKDIDKRLVDKKEIEKRPAEKKEIEKRPVDKKIEKRPVEKKETENKRLKPTDKREIDKGLKVIEIKPLKETEKKEVDKNDIVKKDLKEIEKKNKETEKREIKEIEKKDIKEPDKKDIKEKDKEVEKKDIENKDEMEIAIKDKNQHEKKEQNNETEVKEPESKEADKKELNKEIELRIKKDMEKEFLKKDKEGEQKSSEKKSDRENEEKKENDMDREEEKDKECAFKEQDSETDEASGSDKESELDECNDDDSDADGEFVVGSKVKVKYGRGRQQKIYEAKILEIEDQNGDVHFLVHYTGWNTRYDEWVRRQRVIECVGDKRSTRKRKKMSKSTPTCKNTSKRVGRPIVTTPKSISNNQNSQGSSSSSTSKSKTSPVPQQVKSRTTRSDRNSLQDLPFVNGLESKGPARTRNRKSSGYTESSNDQSRVSDSEENENSDASELEIMEPIQQKSSEIDNSEIEKTSKEENSIVAVAEEEKESMPVFFCVETSERETKTENNSDRDNPEENELKIEQENQSEKDATDKIETPKTEFENITVAENELKLTVEEPKEEIPEVKSDETMQEENISQSSVDFLSPLIDEPMLDTNFMSESYFEENVRDDDLSIIDDEFKESLTLSVEEVVKELQVVKQKMEIEQTVMRVLEEITRTKDKEEEEKTETLLDFKKEVKEDIAKIPNINAIENVETPAEKLTVPVSEPDKSLSEMEKSSKLELPQLSDISFLDTMPLLSVQDKFEKPDKLEKIEFELFKKDKSELFKFHRKNDFLFRSPKKEERKVLDLKRDSLYDFTDDSSLEGTDSDLESMEISESTSSIITKLEKDEEEETMALLTSNILKDIPDLIERNKESGFKYEPANEEKFELNQGKYKNPQLVKETKSPCEEHFYKDCDERISPFEELQIDLSIDDRPSSNLFKIDKGGTTDKDKNNAKEVFQKSETEMTVVESSEIEKCFGISQLPLLQPEPAILCIVAAVSSPKPLIPLEPTLPSIIPSNNLSIPCSSSSNINISCHIPPPSISSLRHNSDASAVLDNTPPTTPESTTHSVSPSRESPSPQRDDNSNKSDKTLCETLLSIRKIESAEDMSQQDSAGTSSDTSVPSLEIIPGSIKRRRDTGDQVPSSSKKRKKSHRKSSTEMSKTSNICCGSNPGCSITVGNNNDTLMIHMQRHQSGKTGSDSDEMPSIMESLANTDSSNNGSATNREPPRPRSPRPSKFNFCIDPTLEGDDRITVLQDKLSEMRKVYMSLKAEVACIDRRRKRAKRKEREAAAAGSTTMEVQCA